MTTCLACAHPVHAQACERKLSNGQPCGCNRTKGTRFALEAGGGHRPRRTYLAGGCGCLGDYNDSPSAFSLVGRVA